MGPLHNFERIFKQSIKEQLRKRSGKSPDTLCVQQTFV